MTNGSERNDLGFLVVMGVGPEAMTKRNQHHFLKFLVMGHRNVVVLMKIYNKHT